MISTRFAKWNLIVVSVLLVILFFWLDPSGRSAGWTRFFGRMHPAVVHLPIGMMILAFLLAVLQRFGWLKDGDSIINLTLIVGSWAGIKAIFAGSWLAQNGGYPEDLLFLHRVLGFGVVLLSAGLALIRSGVDFSFKGSAIATFMWGLMVAGLLVGGDLGGRITHGEGYVTQYAPEILKDIMGQPQPLKARFSLSNPGTTSVYEGIVSPILSQKCTACHGADRSRGRLRLDSPEAIEASEGDEPLIVAGRPEESALIQRISLPEGHEDQMPPSFRAHPISSADVELLKWWVSQGASFEATISDTPIPGHIYTILQAYGMDEMRTGVFALDIPAPDSALISAWQSKGVRVDRLAESENLISVACRVVSDCLASDEAKQLAQQITWLDLRGSDMADADLALLAGFPNLTRLNLSGTAITGADNAGADNAGSGLAALASLEYLEYINLYDTNVTDQALQGIAPIKTLTAVYLWQTAVTPEGIAQLKSALPDAQIDTGEAN